MGPASPKLLAREPVFKFEYDKATRTVRPNPEWVRAPYEICFIVPGGNFIKHPFDPYTLRFHSKEDAEIFLKIV
jgi:hypothetical protein